MAKDASGFDIQDYIPDQVRSFFYAPPPGGAPLTLDALQSRRKIAEAIMARRRGAAPKNIGEGLTALGEGIGDRASLNEIDRREREYAAQIAELAKGNPIPGAAPAPAPAAARTSEVDTSVPPLQRTADAGGDAGDAGSGDTDTSAFNQPVTNAGRFNPTITNMNSGNSVIAGQPSPNSFGNRAYGPLTNVPSAAVSPDPARDRIALAAMGGNTPMAYAAPGGPPPNFTEPEATPPAMTGGEDTTAITPNPVRLASLGGGMPARDTQAAVGNPAITVPDIALAPTRVAQAGGNTIVPRPEATLPPQPQAPQPGGRTPTPPVKVYGEPPAPRLADPGRQELEAIRKMQLFPNDTNVKAILEPIVQTYAARRKADYDQAKLDYDLRKAEYEKTQEVGRKVPETEVARQKAEFELEALKRARGEGGLTDTQKLAIIEKSHATAEPVIGATEQLRNARRVLSQDPGMFTGPAADARLNIERFMALVQPGRPLDPRIPATEAFRSYISSALGTLRPQVAGTGSQSNAELNILRDASGANISLTRPAIEAIINALDKLNVIAAQRHQQKLATFAGPADQPDYENRKGTAFNYFGLPMEDILPDTAIAIFKQRHQANPEQAIEEINRRYHTPGLGQAILNSGR